MQLYAFAWLFGFFTSLTVYYVIAKYISPPTSAQVEEAVLPPQKGDVSPISGEEEISEKEGAIVKDDKEIV